MQIKDAGDGSLEALPGSKDPSATWCNAVVISTGGYLNLNSHPQLKLRKIKNSFLQSH